MESLDYKLIAWFGLATALTGSVFLYVCALDVGQVFIGAGALASAAGVVGALWNS